MPASESEVFFGFSSAVNMRGDRERHNLIGERHNFACVFLCSATEGGSDPVVAPAVRHLWWSLVDDALVLHAKRHMVKVFSDIGGQHISVAACTSAGKLSWCRTCGR